MIEAAHKERDKQIEDIRQEDKKINPDAKEIELSYHTLPFSGPRRSKLDILNHKYVSIGSKEWVQERGDIYETYCFFARELDQPLLKKEIEKLMAEAEKASQNKNFEEKCAICHSKEEPVRPFRCGDSFHLNCLLEISFLHYRAHDNFLCPGKCRKIFLVNEGEKFVIQDNLKP